MPATQDYFAALENALTEKDVGAETLRVGFLNLG